jgi:glyoxylate reductase
MPTRKPLVIVTRKLPDVVETRMRELFDTRLNNDDQPMSQADLVAAVGQAEVLVPTVTDRIDKSVLMQAGEQLKIIANFGNGVDHIDVDTATARGITVTNTPGVLTEDTADMTMALILAVARRIIEGAKVIGLDNSWQGWSPTWMLGHRITGKRLGIVGMGRIGQALARRARAFGLQVHYHNRKPVHSSIEEALEATYWESLDQMLARMDMISVNCPHTPATYHLLSARRLKLMKPRCDHRQHRAWRDHRRERACPHARGGRARRRRPRRVRARAGGQSAAAEMQERRPPAPHMGSATIEGRIDMGEKVILNIKTFTDGHTPPDRVLPSML